MNCKSFGNRRMFFFKKISFSCHTFTLQYICIHTMCISTWAEISYDVYLYISMYGIGLYTVSLLETICKTFFLTYSEKNNGTHLWLKLYFYLYCLHNKLVCLVKHHQFFLHGDFGWCLMFYFIFHWFKRY